MSTPDPGQPPPDPDPNYSPPAPMAPPYPRPIFYGMLMPPLRRAGRKHGHASLMMRHSRKRHRKSGKLKK